MTKVLSSLATFSCALAWVVDSACKPRKAMRSEAPSSAPKPVGGIGAGRARAAASCDSAAERS